MVQTVRELFEHELGDIYYAEHQLVKALDELAGESSDPKVREAFAEHRTQTEGHIERLDQVFASLGKKSQGIRCPGIEGLIEEKKEFTKADPDSRVLDLYNLNAGAKAERYEISAYDGLIGMADRLGMTEAEELLRQNLQEEKKALSLVTNLSKTALQQAPIGAAASRR